MEPEPDREWRALHPASLAVNLVPDLWRTLRQAWLPLVAVVVYGQGSGFFDLFLLGAFLAAAAARTTAHFVSLRYRVHEGKLEIRSGILARKHRVIDASRIQDVAIVQNVFHKLAGLVELRLETAGGDGGAEGLLSAIRADEAQRLREVLARHRGEIHAEVETLQTLSPAELLGFGVSAGRVGTAAVVLGLVMDAAVPVAPGMLPGGTELMRGRDAVGVFLLVLAVGYALSVGGAVLRFARFRLIRTAAGLAIESGLFTRQRVEIPARRVQRVLVLEPVLRRWMGYATVGIETAAVSGTDAAGVGGEAVLPMVHADDLAVLLPQVLPGLRLDGWPGTAARPPVSALVPALVAATIRWSALGAAAAIFLDAPWVLGLVAWGWLSSALDWRGQGWAVDGTHVLSRQGFVRRFTTLVHREKIQSVRWVQGPVQRALGLGRVVLWVPGGRVVLPSLPAAEARALADALRERRAA